MYGAGRRLVKGRRVGSGSAAGPLGTSCAFWSRSSGCAGRMISCKDSGGKAALRFLENEVRWWGAGTSDDRWRGMAQKSEFREELEWHCRCCCTRRLGRRRECAAAGKPWAVAVEPRGCKVERTRPGPWACLLYWQGISPWGETDTALL